ncbi:hypothetical protein GGX14DRAFT_391605 [Mycena pura]|uniref:Uncharacterized protein n=1 Tax=Mycena pura TaxID=153505 RepID=A0AAD6VLQ6_9AGAR|nr:hypothetical protein GGX14DRAFT_391605 [Mycena pura]
MAMDDPRCAVAEREESDAARRKRDLSVPLALAVGPEGALEVHRDDPARGAPVLRLRLHLFSAPIVVARPAMHLSISRARRPAQKAEAHQAGFVKQWARGRWCLRARGGVRTSAAQCTHPPPESNGARRRSRSLFATETAGDAPAPLGWIPGIGGLAAALKTGHKTSACARDSEWPGLAGLGAFMSPARAAPGPTDLGRTTKIRLHRCAIGLHATCTPTGADTEIHMGARYAEWEPWERASPEVLIRV